MQLKENLVRLSKARGWSLSYLARQAHVPKATLHGWITGRAVRDLEQVRRVALVLKIPLYGLLFSDRDPYGP